MYDLEIVGTSVFFFKEFRFKLWDLYDAYNFNNNEVSIRAIAYDPQFYMPSQASFNIKINIPPFNSKLNISPESGESLFTEFEISTSETVDDDIPLVY